MASFATEVKNELARVTGEKRCCRMAELSALLRMGAAVVWGERRWFGLNFATENAAVARKGLTLLKGLGHDIRTEVMVSRAKRLKKNNSYGVRIAPAPNVEALLAALDLLREGSLSVEPDRKILRHHCCRAAYLRGAFLGGGSVSRPESSYHLEMATQSYAFAEFLRHLLHRMEFPVGMTERKGAYVVYLKEGDAVMDFLGMVHADEAVEAFEVARNLKEVRNQVNRLVNCETANLQKAVDAAGRQMKDIRSLQRAGQWESLPELLRETAQARMEHPDASLTELAEILCVSKSGLNHRFRKLRRMAQQAG